MARQRVRDPAEVRAERKRHIAEMIVLVAQLKSVPCKDCSQEYPSYVMDFDHIDAAQKRHNISHLARSGAPRKKILEEIAKCEIVCANCHRIRTHHRARLIQLDAA